VPGPSDELVAAVLGSINLISAGLRPNQLPSEQYCSRYCSWKHPV